MLMDELFCLRLFYNQEYFWSWSVKKLKWDCSLFESTIDSIANIVLANYWIVFQSKNVKYGEVKAVVLGLAKLASN